MDRRRALSTIARATMLAPVIGLQEMTRPPSPQIPPFETGELLTVDRLNDLVERINES